jgi:hypothetical protein
MKSPVTTRINKDPHIGFVRVCVALCPPPIATTTPFILSARVMDPTRHKSILKSLIRGLQAGELARVGPRVNQLAADIALHPSHPVLWIKKETALRVDLNHLPEDPNALSLSASIYKSASLYRAPPPDCTSWPSFKFEDITIRYDSVFFMLDSDAKELVVNHSVPWTFFLCPVGPTHIPMLINDGNLLLASKRPRSLSGENALMLSSSPMKRRRANDGIPGYGNQDSIGVTSTTTPSVAEDHIAFPLRDIDAMVTDFILVFWEQLLKEEEGGGAASTRSTHIDIRELPLGLMHTTLVLLNQTRVALRSSHARFVALHRAAADKIVIPWPDEKGLSAMETRAKLKAFVEQITACPAGFDHFDLYPYIMAILFESELAYISDITMREWLSHYARYMLNWYPDSTIDMIHGSATSLAISVHALRTMSAPHVRSCSGCKCILLSPDITRQCMECSVCLDCTITRVTRDSFNLTPDDTVAMIDSVKQLDFEPPNRPARVLAMVRDASALLHATHCHGHRPPPVAALDPNGSQAETLFTD